MTQATNDLFAITMGQLHQEAPPGLVESLKASLEQIGRKNPNSAQTAKSCLDGLDEQEGPCSLLKVLTAAYLINGGVMLKHALGEEPQQEGEKEEKSLADLEEELLSLGLNEDPETLYGRTPPPAPPERGAAP